MLKTLRCIKFGEVLLDENRQLLLLCSNCHKDYDDLQKFRQHMEFCGATEVVEAPMHGIFGQNVRLIFPNRTITSSSSEEEILESYTNGNKEFLIYKFNGVKKLEAIHAKHKHKNSIHDDEFMDLIKIEEELLDPRWYTESSEKIVESAPQQSSLASYNELVKAVTPFVQFKENLKSNEKQQNIRTLRTYAMRQEPKQENGLILSDKSITLNTKQRKLSTSSQKQVDASIDTQTALAVTKINSKMGKLPLKMLKAISTKDSEKFIVRSNEAFEVCNSKPANSIKITPVKTQIKHLAIKTDAIPTIQRDINPLPISGTKILNAHTSSSTLLSGTAPTPIMIYENTAKNTAVNAQTNSLETEKILNKLQNLGLQVKRKLPSLTQQDQQASSVRNTANDKTLELLRKLQSKGMKVKIVQNTTSNKRTSLIDDIDVAKKPKVENKNGYIESTYSSSSTKKLNLLCPQ